MSIITLNKESDIFRLLEEYRTLMPRLEKRVGSYSLFSQKLVQFAIVNEIIINQQSAGFVIYYANDNNTLVGFITLLVVKQEFRNQHIGTRLMAYSFNEMKKHNMKIVRLQVESENVGAIQFYKKLGFRIISGNEQYIMQKDLTE